MEEKFEIMDLLQTKQSLELKLNSLIYGSVEIREADSNKYIYVHYRDNGIALTKYAGEYSDKLYNLILNNSIEAKKLKKQIRDINKQLKKLNYENTELNSDVMLNIDFAKKNLVSTIYKQAILEGVATTFADTENIIEGGKVNNMTIEDVFNKDIDDIDKALYTMKKQIFIDGNKRTSVIFTNHYLISKGKGLIAIPDTMSEEYKNLLIRYYEEKDEEKIKNFLKTKCYMNLK